MLDDFMRNSCNEKVIIRSGYDREKLMNSLQQRQIKRFVYIMRKESMESVSMIGKIA
jgi:hypothetical protein